MYYSRSFINGVPTKEVIRDFAKVASIDLEKATASEKKLLLRLAYKTERISYDVPMETSYVNKTLREASRQGERVRIVLNRDFWKNGIRRSQTDGWSSHLELYTLRKKK